MAAVAQGIDPWFVNLAVTPEEARAAVTAGFAQGSQTGIMPLPGVIPDAGGTRLAVAQTGSPTMAVVVNQGQCVVARANQYGYVGTMSTAVTVDIAAANATNPRIDSVVYRVRDSDLGDTSNGVWSKGGGIEVLTGTPSGSPVVPTLPAGALLLANVTVGANVTSITNANISDQRVFTASAGGIRYAYNALSVAGRMPWELRTNPNGDGEVYNNSTGLWVPVYSPGSYNTYTPTWSGLQVLGTGAVQGGRWTKVGRRVTVQAWLVGGTGTSLGTSNISVSLPPGQTAVNAATQWLEIGHALHRTAVGQVSTIMQCSIIPNGTSVGVWGISNTNHNWQNPGLVPLSWVAGSAFNIYITYETAA